MTWFRHSTNDLSTEVLVPYKEKKSAFYLKIKKNQESFKYHASKVKKEMNYLRKLNELNCSYFSKKSKIQQVIVYYIFAQKLRRFKKVLELESAKNLIHKMKSVYSKKWGR